MRTDFRYRVLLSYDDQREVVAGVTFDSFERARQYVGPAVQAAKHSSHLSQVEVQRAIAPLSGALRELPTAGLWVTEAVCDRSVVRRIRAQQQTRSRRKHVAHNTRHTRPGVAYVTTAAVVAIVWLAIVLVQTRGEFSKLSQAAQPIAVKADIPLNPMRGSNDVMITAMAAGDGFETQTSGSLLSKSDTAAGSDQR